MSSCIEQGAAAFRVVRSSAVGFLACVCLLGSGATDARAAGSVVQGRVHLSIPGVQLRDVGPVVVYLERLDGEAEAPTSTASLEQKDALFSPGFLVIARGQSIDMPNADAIYHNVFSFSKPNDFDLGLYPAGESRTVRFDHAGVVKIYCSIHESMSATLFVAPEPHHAKVSTSGRFTIENVPPGRYRLSVWCERLPGTFTEVVVEMGSDAKVDVEWTPLASG